MSRRNDISVYILFFVVSPVLALGHTLRHPKAHYFKNILWLFCGYYGFNFVSRGNYDAARYSRRFANQEETTTGFFDIINNIYFGDSEQADVLEALLSYSVSRFTDDPRWLFLSFALIFGFFYSRNIYNILTYYYHRKLSLPYWLLFFSFAMVIPIHEINVFRWMTAAQVFFYGVTNYYLLGNKKRGLIAIVFPIFIHFTFLSAIGLFLVSLVAIKFKKLLYILFFSSFIISTVGISSAESLLNKLPGFAQDKYSVYVSDKYLEERRDTARSVELSFHARYQKTAINLSLVCLVIFIMLNQRIITDDNLSKLFFFSLFFFSVFNTLSALPSISRFINLGRMFLIGSVFLAMYANAVKRVVKYRLLLALSPFLFLYSLVRFRLEMEFMNIITLIGNPIIALFYTDDVPIVAFIKDTFL